MGGEFNFMRMVAVCGGPQDADLFRQGASLASIPIELTAPANTTAATLAIAREPIDVVFVEQALAEREPDFVAAARSERHPAFVVLLAPTQEAAAALAAGGAAVDAVAVKPGKLADAKALIEGCVRLKVPSQALVVDDSATMRNIVRRVLASCRFPMTVFEAKEGVEALKQVGEQKFDYIFLDYNMPDLDGLAALAEIRKQQPKVGVVLMTSDPDAALAERARAAGAIAFLKKPFYPAAIDAVLFDSQGLRRPAGGKS